MGSDPRKGFVFEMGIGNPTIETVRLEQSDYLSKSGDVLRVVEQPQLVVSYLMGPEEVILLQIESHGHGTKDVLFKLIARLRGC